MQRWSFNLQIFFLNSRFNQIQEIRGSGKDVIQDRTIYEDAHIFAPNLHAMGLMTTRDFDNYFALFSSMEAHVPAPDLLIYLRASVPTCMSKKRTLSERPWRSKPTRRTLVADPLDPWSGPQRW